MALVLAVFHINFPKIFKWKAEYEGMTGLNRRIFHTIHLALLLIFIGNGILAMFYANELSECNGISFGLNVVFATFWLWRAAWQVYYFKGKAMHYVLIATFTVLSVCYCVPVIKK